MSDCSNHKKELFGIGNMRIVADRISELHYETLTELMGHLADKIWQDSVKDIQAGRQKLGWFLHDASMNIRHAGEEIRQAWNISKPFMNNNPSE